MSIIGATETLCITKGILHFVFNYRDMAVMNKDGLIRLQGRKSDRLRFKIEGEIVYPAVIENAMAHHPAVKEISVRLIFF